MSAENLKIAAWNIEDGLSSEARSHAVVDRIMSLDVDIMVLPEAFGDEVSHEDTIRVAETELEDAGYRMHVTPYHDSDERPDEHWFAALVRDSVEVNVTTMLLGTRHTLSMQLKEIPLTITGVHLDDRQELTRQQQAVHLAEQHSETQPNLLLGDFNAMHRDDNRARVLRAASFMANHLPVIDLGEETLNLAHIRQLGNLSFPLVDRASDGTMSFLERVYGYEDVDLARLATIGSLQIDHMLTNFATTVEDEWLKITNYTVHDTPESESYHRPISAVIEY